MPVRGLGAKNVVFSGMRTPATAAARMVATLTGRSRTAASAVPFVDLARRRSRRRCGRRGSRRRARRGARRRRSGPSRRRGAAPGARPCAASSSARGRAARGRRVDEPEPRRARASPPRARRRRRARWGPRRAPTNAGRERVAQVDAADAVRASRWMARTQSCSSASSTTRVMIASAPGVVAARARRGRCATVSKRWWPSASTRPAPATAAGMAAMPLGVVDGDELVARRRRRRAATAVGAPSVSSSDGEPGGEREAPDRVEVGARRAQQLEAVALGLRAACARGAARRRGSRPQRADHARWSCAACRRRPVKSSGTPRTSVARPSTSTPSRPPLRERGRRRRRRRRGGSDGPTLCGSRRAARRDRRVRSRRRVVRTPR